MSDIAVNNSMRLNECKNLSCQRGVLKCGLLSGCNTGHGNGVDNTVKINQLVSTSIILLYR